MISLDSFRRLESAEILARLQHDWHGLPTPLHAMRERLLAATHAAVENDALVLTLEPAAVFPPEAETDPDAARRFLLDVCGFSEANIAGNPEWMLLSRAKNEMALLHDKQPGYFCLLPDSPDPKRVEKKLAKVGLHEVTLMRDFVLAFDGLRDGSYEFVSFDAWETTKRALKGFEVTIPQAWQKALTFFRPPNDDAIGIDPSTGKIALVAHDDGEALREWPSFQAFIADYPYVEWQDPGL